MTRTQTIDRPVLAHVEAATLLDERQTPGTLLPTRVESLFETARSIHEKLDPIDVDRPLSQGFFRYVDGRAAFAWRNVDGSFSNPENFTRRGLSQLGYRVLGGGGTKYMNALADQGGHGTKLAEVNWNFSLLSQTSPALLRTIQLPGERYRTIRAALSGGGKGYSVIDNVDLLEMFIESPELRELPIIESKITEDSMRIRFLLDPADAALFDPTTGRVRNPSNSHFTTLNLPVPMGELYNGETGNSSVRFNYGTYFIRCLNGLGGYGGDSSNWRWNHTGGEDRAEKIKSGLGDAIKSARVMASGQIEDYKASIGVAIDDAFALLDAWGGELTETQRNRAKDATRDESSIPGGKLASLVDGITLAAQSESDVVKQRDLEAFAARLLKRGLDAARKNDGRIVVAAA